MRLLLCVLSCAVAVVFLMPEYNKPWIAFCGLILAMAFTHDSAVAVATRKFERERR